MKTLGEREQLRAQGPGEHDSGARRAIRRWELIAAGAAVFVVVWAFGILIVPALRFAVIAPQGAIGVESASALARLFAALVLFFFPSHRSGERLRWVAIGLVVLGVGGLIFGYLQAVSSVHPSLNTAAWEWLGVRTLAGAVLALGLTAPVVPRLTTRVATGIILFLFLLSALITAAAGHLPILVPGNGLAPAVARSQAVMPDLTIVYWLLGAVPLALTVAAAIGAARQVRTGAIGGWLLLAMILLAGSQLHSTFWPAVYSPVLTTADLLRLLFAVVVTIGGVFELRAVSLRRAALLTAEQEQSRRLAELSEMKASFTSMVVHELGSPLAAIRRIVELGQTGRVDPERALQTIGSEAALLATLIDDMNVADHMGSPDFQIDVRPVPVAALVADAENFARTLPGDHPLIVSAVAGGRVLADRERVGQVLRNLLGNAAKYTEPGSAIELRVTGGEAHVRIAVVDQGPGIPPADQARIFEKFGRGSAPKAPGIGLGLYLSRRIVNAHGCELALESGDGAGAVFSFELVRAPEAPLNGAVPVDLLLVDDHAAFREPLALLLGQDDGVNVVAQVRTVEEARRALPGVNLALVDLELPGSSGIELIEELTERHPEIRSIVLTAAVDRRQIARAVEAGAAAVVHKSARIEEVRDIMQRVARGEDQIQKSGLIELLQRVRQEREHERAAREALDQLTPREREVLQALAEGMSDKQVAARLHISTATARTHVVRILGKLGVGSRLQAVVFAGRHKGVGSASDPDLQS